MGKTKVTKDLESKSLTIEREFDAPLPRLWDAFARPELFVQWWGPEGWETTVKEFEFAEGGRNHYCMKCVDESQGEWFGQESWGLMKFESIDEPSSFSFKDYFTDAEGIVDSSMPTMASIIEFREKDGKTYVTNTGTVETTEQLEQLIKMGMIEGFSSSLDKLEKIILNN